MSDHKPTTVEERKFWKQEAHDYCMRKSQAEYWIKIPKDRLDRLVNDVDRLEAMVAKLIMEKMPEPLEVWLHRDHRELRYCMSGYKPDKALEIVGPHKLVPGMMSLDELAAKYFYIAEIDNGRWRVSGRAAADPGYHDTYPTALEAQWAATCLAKEKIQS